MGIKGKNSPQPSMMPASMPLSVMLKFGKLITPKTAAVTLIFQVFSVMDMKWLEPFQVRLLIQKEKFASGNFCNAYEANAMSAIQNKKYVLKKMKDNQIRDIGQFTVVFCLTLHRCNAQWSPLSESLHFFWRIGWCHPKNSPVTPSPFSLPKYTFL